VDRIKIGRWIGKLVSLFCRLCIWNKLTYSSDLIHPPIEFVFQLRGLSFNGL